MVSVSFSSLAMAIATTIIPSAQSAMIDLPIHFENSYVSLLLKILGYLRTLLTVISNYKARVQAQVGSPPLTYVLMFDTGSSSTWIDDQHCAIVCDNRSGYVDLDYIYKRRLI